MKLNRLIAVSIVGFSLLTTSTSAFACDHDHDSGVARGPGSAGATTTMATTAVVMMVAVKAATAPDMTVVVAAPPWWWLD